MVRSSGFVWNSWQCVKSETFETLIGSPLSTKLYIEEASEVRPLPAPLNVAIIATAGAQYIVSNCEQI
jgi:hypothetical protein